MYCSRCGTRLEDSIPARCRQCGATHWDDAKPCAGAAVVHEGQLLLVRRRGDPWRGRWDVPGGFCERGEHPIETAVRELAEETGIEIEVTGILGMWTDEYTDAAGTSKGTLNIYYHATPRNGIHVPEHGESDEVSELGWFAPSALPPADTIAFPNHVPAMLAAWQRAMQSGATRTALFDTQPLGR
jgi:8-oxo-dGTP diphosphatase